MKKLFVILTVIFLVGFMLYGCSSMRNPTDKHALITLAGGAAGALLTFNTGGAIVGAFVADVVNLSVLKYEDKQLEDRDEASRRVKDRFKAEKKEEDKKAEKLKEDDKKAEKEKREDKKAERNKKDDKKAEELKEDDKKAEKEKREDKKAERNKEDDKKAEELKEDNKKAEKEKREERRVELFIENSSVISHNVKSGSIAEANVQYTLLAPVDMSQIKITETRILHTTARRVELDKREINRAQGTYISTIKFTIPDNTPKGYCILFTTISDGTHAKTTRSVMNII